MERTLRTGYSGCYIIVQGDNVYYTQDDWNMADRYMGTVDTLKHIIEVIDRYLQIKFS